LEAIELTESVKSFQVQRPFYLRLAAELSFRADFARERVSLPMRTNGADPPSCLWCPSIPEIRANVYGDFLRKMTIRDCSCHCRDVAHLRREVGRHEIHVVGQIFQVPATPFTFAWPPSFSFRAYFAATRVTSERKALSRSTIAFTVLAVRKKLSFERLSFNLSSHRFG